MNKSRVLLAVGNENVSSILRKYLREADYLQLIDQEVMHFRYFEEILELHEPDILIVHDVFLPSDTSGKSEREAEWLNFFHALRQNYDNLRIVFLCERSRDDIFLNQIVGLGVLDIFNETAIDMSTFIKQLSEPARYVNVAKFRDESFATVKFTSDDDGTPGDEEREELEETKQSKEKEDTQAEKNKADSGSEDDIKEKEEDVAEQQNPEEPSAPPEGVRRRSREREKKEKVKERVIEKLVPFPIEKKIILVGAPFARNGSTFVSHLLAKEISNLNIPVTYIENPFRKVYTFDRFDGNRKVNNYRSIFYSYFEEEQIPDVTNEWEEEGVKIVAKHPKEDNYNEEQITFELFIKFLLKVESPITIIDIGDDWDRSVIRELFEVASAAFMVIEPDISDAHYLEDPDNNETAYYRYLVNDEKTYMIGNRMEESLQKNKLIDELYGDKLIATIPSISSELVFNCQDKGTFINGHAKINTKKMTEPVIKEIVPDHMLKRRKRKPGIFANLLHT
jgi:hypothetical protein